jgi:hypothetical protein
MHHVNAVELVRDYTVRLCFSTGEWRIIDLEPHLWGPVFEPLKSLDMFTKVIVDPEAETLVWPNGADFAPVFLYEHSQAISDVA